VPCESLDAPDNLPKKSRRQVALRQLQDEVPRMSDEAPAGLEQPLLQTRQRPALDGEGQGQPAKQIAEVVGDDPEQQADLVGSEAVAGEAGPMGGFLTFLDPPSLVSTKSDPPQASARLISVIAGPRNQRNQRATVDGRSPLGFHPNALLGSRPLMSARFDP
jgi:hypothetical protein